MGGPVGGVVRLELNLSHKAKGGLFLWAFLVFYPRRCGGYVWGRVELKGAVEMFLGTKGHSLAALGRLSGFLFRVTPWAPEQEVGWVCSGWSGSAPLRYGLQIQIEQKRGERKAPIHSTSSLLYVCVMWET